MFCLHVPAQLSNRGIISVDSLLFLPEVVLHVSDLAFHKLTIMYLLVDIQLLISDLGDLPLNCLYIGLVINFVLLLSCDLNFISTDLHLELSYLQLLVLEKSSCNISQVNFLELNRPVGWSFSCPLKYLWIRCKKAFIVHY
jgi:hypothetical protein